MADGSIPDSDITASIEGESASQARLNGDGAWCFLQWENRLGPKVTLTITFPGIVLVSGLQSQGPPSNVEERGYSIYIGFKVFNSTSLTDDDFRICCDDKELTNFADDKSDEIDVVTIHPFPTLLVARRLRLEFDTALMWPGDNKKCFRFEVIGCPPDAQPKTDLVLEAVPSGWVVGTWNVPSLFIPDADGDIQESLLESTTYVARLERTGGGEDDEVTEWEVGARRCTVPSPLWGATYSISVTCNYQGLNLTCGSFSIQAELASCDPEQSTCLITDQVIFRSPLKLQAAVIDEQQVELQWSSESTGWRTAEVILLVIDNGGQEIERQTLPNTDNTSIVTGVSGGQNYSVSFMPRSSGQDLATFSFNLHILAWSGVRLSDKEEGYGAFVTDVGLLARYLMNGNMRVSWTRALVLGVSWEDPEAEELVPEPPADVEETTPTPTVAPTDSDTGNDTFAIDSDLTDGNSTDEAAIEDVSGSDAISTGGESASDVLSTGGESDDASLTLDSVTASPTPVENRDATAFMYTVFLRSENEERVVNVTDIASEIISVDIDLLTFETQYEISLTCHFGDVSVLCGSAEVYTSLPVHWTILENNLIVYSNSSSFGGWDAQETECASSEGSLVSLADRTEDERLIAALSQGRPQPILDTFWIGYKVCQGSAGGWSDGSRWDHSRIPGTDPGLTSETCCIKAVWNAEFKLYFWLGEACDALLPAICEFQPEGMVGKITSSARVSADKTAATVSFAYRPEYWNASNIALEFCPALRLVDLGAATPTEEILENCTTSLARLDAIDFTQRGLVPFTEYNVSISALIGVLNFTGEPSQLIVRTFPETPLIVRVLPTGQLFVQYAQKVAEFAERDQVEMTVRDSSKPNEILTTQTIEAIGFTLDDISLGTTYTVTVKEGGENGREETAVVQAFPSCDCIGCQVEGFCHRVSDQQSAGFSAEKECLDRESILLTVVNSSQVDLLLPLAEALRDDIWVNSESKRVTATDPDSRDTAALVGDSEIVDDEVAEEERESMVCLMVSRARRAVVVEPCSMMHMIACRHKAPVSSAFPPVDEIKRDVGGSWFTLDWEWQFGWKATYWVIYQDLFEKRYKRAVKTQAFLGPPVVISELLLDTTYAVELVADIGNGFRTTSGEFYLTTTNDTTRASTSDLLIVSSVSFGSPQILQLVCSSLLVAACICTMLLFFATGMFYQDCVAHLGFLGTLMAAFLNLILAHPNPVRPENQTGCVTLGIVLHYLFLCAFVFLMLESLTYAHLLVTPIKSPFQKSNWLLMAFGLVIPLIIVGVCAGFTYSEYPDFQNSNCWLDGTGGAIWGEVIPIFIVVVASIVLLLSTVCNKETPPELIEINLRSRQGDSHKLRWVVLAMVVLLALVWAIGVASYNTKDPSTQTMFCIFTLILAITILGVRTTFDDTFRSKMHRLCCGTELTYKRSEVVSLSGKSRVGPSPTNQSGIASAREEKNYSTKEERMTTVLPSAETDYTLPNTPPQKGDQQHVLIRRSYHFDDDTPLNFDFG